jgi:hypothetical protein
MPSTRTAYITGFAPFPNKRVIPGIGTMKKRYSKKSKSVPTAMTGFVMSNHFIGYNKAMIFKAKPFAAFGTVDGMNPVNDMRGEKYP